MEQGYKYDRSNFINNPFDEKLMQISENMSFALPKYKAYNFVGGAQITPYARLKQWLLELRGREDAVEHLEYTVRKAELEIQMDEESKEFITDAKRKEMVVLTIADKRIDLRKFNRNLIDAYRERQGFIDLIKEYLETDDATLPDGSKLIDVFGNPDLEEKYEHDDSDFLENVKCNLRDSDDFKYFCSIANPSGSGNNVDKLILIFNGEVLFQTA